MMFQLKPRLAGLLIRAALPILSAMTGSGPQTAALHGAAQAMAGPASGPSAPRVSGTAYRRWHGGARHFAATSAIVMELDELLAPVVAADTVGLDFVRRIFLIQQAW